MRNPLTPKPGRILIVSLAAVMAAAIGFWWSFIGISGHMILLVPLFLLCAIIIGAYL